MKKILHIITSLSDGGAEAVLYRLCIFDKKNTHIVISLMGEGKYGSLLENSGVTVHCLDMPEGKIHFKALIKLRKLIRHFKPDVVQTWMYHADLIGGVIGRLAGIKNIIWGVHNTTLVKGKSKRSTIIIAKLNAFISYFVPKRIIYCAETSRQVQESIGFNSKIGYVVPNGYSIDDFMPNPTAGIAFRDEIKLANDKFLIGHVGRYDPQKDHETLLLSLSILKEIEPGFELLLVGTDLDEANVALSNIIDDKKLSCVKRLGRRNDIPEVMNALDLFVLSSAFGEAFPNVLNEAMACGTPCVTTDIGDAAFIVGDTGWIVPPRNPQALAKAMSEAVEEKLNNPNAWEERKLRCRKRIVNNFSIEKMVTGYHHIWFNK